MKNCMTSKEDLLFQPLAMFVRACIGSRSSVSVDKEVRLHLAIFQLVNGSAEIQADVSACTTPLKSQLVSPALAQCKRAMSPASM